MACGQLTQLLAASKEVGLAHGGQQAVDAADVDGCTGYLRDLNKLLYKRCHVKGLTYKKAAGSLHPSVGIIVPLQKEKTVFYMHLV